MGNETFKLDDSVIAQIVRILQLAFMTQTDVSDHLRMIELENSSVDGKLYLTNRYKQAEEDNIQKLLDEAADAMAQKGSN